MNKNFIFIITGKMASGKSYTVKTFKQIALKKNITFNTLSTDEIRRYILSKSREKDHIEIRKRLSLKIGINSIGKENFINRKKLGEIIYFDNNKYNFYCNLINNETIKIIKKKLSDFSGIVAIEAAFPLDNKILLLAKNKILLVACSCSIQKIRLKNLDISTKQLQKRLYIQNYYYKKNKQYFYKNKNLLIIDTSKNPTEDKYLIVFNRILKRFNYDKNRKTNIY